MSIYTCTTEFEMDNGSVLSCVWHINKVQGVSNRQPEYCFPTEFDASEPVYFIDDKESRFKDLDLEKNKNLKTVLFTDNHSITAII